MWSAVEKSLSPVTTPIILQLAHSNCCIYPLLMSLVSVGPSQISLPETCVDILWLEGGFSTFQRKDEAKMFSAELFLIPKTPVPYLVSHVSKISNTIKLHRPQWRNFPKDFSPPLGWPHQFFSPISLYNIWANSRWVCRTRYNHQDNVRLCKP